MGLFFPQKRRISKIEASEFRQNGRFKNVYFFVKILFFRHFLSAKSFDFYKTGQGQEKKFLFFVRNIRCKTGAGRWWNRKPGRQNALPRKHETEKQEMTRCCGEDSIGHFLLSYAGASCSGSPPPERRVSENMQQPRALCMLQMEKP